MKASLKSSRGIALVMVLGVIALLSYILLDFTFESKLNKMRVNNNDDKNIAKMNAEAGLRLSLAKLTIYQHAFNEIEKNETLKENLKGGELETAITLPFMYPPIELPGADIITRNAISEFGKSIILNGELMVSTSPVTGLLNPNLMRVKKLDQENEKSKNENTPPDTNTENETIPVDVDQESLGDFIQTKLVESLQEIIDSHKESDEEFEAKFKNIEAKPLINELKYFISNEGEMDEADRADAQAKFMEKKIIPKRAPLTSLDELYLLPSWPDEIVDLFKGQLNVLNVGIIHINEINEGQLKIIFPKLSKQEVSDFFKHRDGDPKKQTPPHPFKGEEDFKSYMTSTGGLEEKDFDERMQKLSKAGLTLGTVAKMFKVISQGKMGRSTYKITAIINMPYKKAPKKTKPNESTTPENIEPTPPPVKPEGGTEKPKKVPKELLRPRIVDLRIS